MGLLEVEYYSAHYNYFKYSRARAIINELRNVIKIALCTSWGMGLANIIARAIIFGLRIFSKKTIFF